ncbi:Uncharacterised protein [Shigella sonnei]|nr:Uncharacterised protein [Shigella sonnei]
MVILREVDGGIVTNHHMILHRLEGNTVIHRTARHRVHILKVEAQLVGRAQFQRRNRDIRFAIQQTL